MDQSLSAITLTPISPLKRIALVSIGTVTLGLGIAGMFLPGVPTTVFLLITMACYVRSSDRLYRWVMTRSWLQKPIKTALDFQQRGTLPVRIKLVAQGVAWSSFVLVVFNGAKPIFEMITLLLAASCSIAMSIIKSEGQPYAPRAWRMTAGDIARQLWLGVQAGALAGIVWGVGAQTFARFVANLSGASMQSSLLSTLMFVFGSMVIGALGGLLYAGVRRVLFSNKWLSGAAFGVLMIVIVAGVTMMVAPAAQGVMSQFSAGLQGLFFILIVLNFIAAGIIASLGYRSLEMRVK